MYRAIRKLYITRLSRNVFIRVLSCFQTGVVCYVLTMLLVIPCCCCVANICVELLLVAASGVYSHLEKPTFIIAIPVYTWLYFRSFHIKYRDIAAKVIELSQIKLLELPLLRRQAVAYVLYPQFDTSNDNVLVGTPTLFMKKEDYGYRYRIPVKLFKEICEKTASFKGLPGPNRKSARNGSTLILACVVLTLAGVMLNWLYGIRFVSVFTSGAFLLLMLYQIYTAKQT